MISTKTLGRALALAISFWALAANAAPPDVSTVPVDPNDPIQPHDVISGKPTTLKGAVDEASVGSTWTWDPGDGSPSVSGTVNPAATAISQMDDSGFTPHYAIWLEHTYTGTDGDVFLATLTVTNGVGESDSAVYRMRVRDATITTEVNVAIDEALWFMHRNFFRFDGRESQANGSTTAGTVPMGKWDFVQTGGTAQASSTAAALNAFEANGYLPSGPASSPYTETAKRALRYVIASLDTQNIGPQTFARPAGVTDDPDFNGNGIGVYGRGIDPTYQGGMLMDAIIASGTPDAVADTGWPGVIGRTYRDIIQDMVDWYAFAQSDSTVHGGWVYTAYNNSGGAHDNSAGGWAAIGLVAAEDIFGATVPDWVKERNRNGLEFTDFESDTDDYICCGNDRGDGTHGYRSTTSAWGPFSTTSAAMVQMTMDDIEATSSATPDERWIRSENFFRRHFNSPVTGNNFKNYYYAMFNFAKAMRTAVPEEIVLIGTDNSVGCGPGGGTPGCSDVVAPLDWYLDPVDGLARTVVDYQVGTGVNIGMFTDRAGNSHGSRQDEHNTSWATQILTRTLFQAGPVARASATPNPGASNSPILLDGSDSFHQDPARSLVSYEWDFDNDGAFDASGAQVTASFDCPTLPVPCEFPVRLRVRDDNVPARFDDDVVVVEITIPPRPPTADAGGPYLACANEEFALDGSGSSDVDEGTSESGSEPFDTITAYNWELDGISPFDFDESSGVSPLISFPTPSTRDIGLQVADNTAAAFPTAGVPNLTDRDFTSVTVGDCACIGPVMARTKSGKAQLVWQPVPGAATYDILRSVKGSAERYDTVAVDHVTNYATYLDRGLTNGITYWYRVVPKGADGMPICAFSQAVAATPQASRRARADVVQVPSVVGQEQSTAEATLLNVGLAVGDISFANDALIPEGSVVSSSPAAGNSVVEGTAVALVISLGPVRVAVPEIVGETGINAEAAILGAGLAVGSITTQNSDTVPEGRVISQDPPGGVQVVLGSAVNFVVSLGPVTTTVPNVVGDTQASGAAAITAASLTVGAVTTGNSDTVPAGSIISQNPAGGTEVVPGTAVDLVVSSGPVTTVVPDVIGLSQADAEDAILAADLTIGSIVTQNSATVPAGNVINQSPGAGSNVVPGVSVNLVVSLGPVQVIVPSVVGLAQADAEAALVGADLGPGAVTEENSLTVPPGNVISQEPAAGTEVSESSLVALVVSLGPRQVTVPGVVGQTQAAAEAAIVAADLAVGTVGTANSTTVDSGDVISQNPSGGTVVDEQSAVDIVVSLGPVQVTVPGVVGLTQGAAEAAILAADLTVGAVTTANDPVVPVGEVISQNPAAAAVVDEGSAVDIVVSLGPVQVSVPNVVGLTQASAEAAITGAGLTVGAATTANSDTVPIGDVISQDPAAGTTVDENSAVSIVVSTGPDLVSVPDVVGLSQAAAEAAITAGELQPVPGGTAFSDTVPAGDVVSQNPLAGSLVARDSNVSIVISDGPEPVVVPDVVGLQKAAAEGALTGAGLALGEQTATVDGAAGAGEVLSQNPAAGTAVQPGTPVDLVIAAAAVASADVELAPEVIQTSGAGGSTDAECRVTDANGLPILPPPPLTFATDASAIISATTNFAYPDPGEYGISCDVTSTGVSASATVVVLDDSIDPLFSQLDSSLSTFVSLNDQVVEANEAEDEAGLQSARNSLIAEIGDVDLAALAASPPMPTGANVPTAAELTSAGDTPDPAVDDPFVAAVQGIEQNLIDTQALLGTFDPATWTQLDVDEFNALIAEGNALLSTLETNLDALGEPSNTAILVVNNELNNIVTNLIPNQGVDLAQANVDIIFDAGIASLEPGWRIDLDGPQQMYAGLMPDARGPADYYDEAQETFSFIGLMTSQSIANGLRSRYIKTVYKPIMKQIAKNIWFLRNQDLGPFGIDPPVLDFVFGPGSSSVSPGNTITLFGSNFSPNLGDNEIEITTLRGVFVVPSTAISLGGSGSDDILEGFPIPSGMCNCAFGLPETGVVRVITPGGTSNGIQVNVFR